MIVNGPFMMNDQSQIDDAVERYRIGQMGNLAPASDEVEGLRTRKSV